MNKSYANLKAPKNRTDFLRILFYFETYASPLNYVVLRINWFFFMISYLALRKVAFGFETLSLSFSTFVPF